MKTQRVKAIRAFRFLAKLVTTISEKEHKVSHVSSTFDIGFELKFRKPTAEHDLFFTSSL